MKYTPFGELQQYQQGTSGQRIVRTNTYDDATRWLKKSYTDRDAPDGAEPSLSAVDYSHDLAGNVTKISDLQDATTRDTQCFRHDYLQRMTDAWTTSGEACSGPTGASGPQPYWKSYAYDKSGSRLSETDHLAEGGPHTRKYEYPDDKSKHPHALTEVSAKAGQTAPDTYEYDATGNTTRRNADGIDQKLEWDAEGNLTKVTENGRVTEYVYDAEGERLLRKTPEGTTLYLGGTEVLLEQTTQKLSGTRYYHHGENAVAQRDSEGDVQFLAADHHGTAFLAIGAIGRWE